MLNQYELSPYEIERSYARYHGLSIQRYEDFLEQENGVCAICKKTNFDKKHTRLCIDRDPNTRKVRGLLCHLCNTALDKFKDSPELLQKAINYLSTDANTRP